MGKMHSEPQSLMTLELAHKGRHPGAVVAEMLKEMGCPQRQLAFAVDEFPQTLWSILQGKRSMNTKLATKIEQRLSLPTGYLMTLQLFHDLASHQK